MSRDGHHHGLRDVLLRPRDGGKGSARTVAGQFVVLLDNSDPELAVGAQHRLVQVLVKQPAQLGRFLQLLVVTRERNHLRQLPVVALGHLVDHGKDGHLHGLLGLLHEHLEHLAPWVLVVLVNDLPHVPHPHAGAALHHEQVPHPLDARPLAASVVVCGHLPLEELTELLTCQSEAQHVTFGHLPLWVEVVVVWMDAQRPRLGYPGAHRLDPPLHRANGHRRVVLVAFPVKVGRLGRPPLLHAPDKVGVHVLPRQRLARLLTEAEQHLEVGLVLPLRCRCTPSHLAR